MKQYLSIGLDVFSRWFNPSISRINLATTWRCTHKCATCNIWQQPVDLNHYEVTAEEVEKIVVANKLMWVSLTGGEPFLNNEIEGIIKAGVSHCRMVSITTNGWMTDRITQSVCRASKEGGAIVIVNVSLHGENHTHDKFVGVEGAYKHSLMTLDALSYYDPRKVKVGIEYLITPDSKGDMDDIQYLASFYNASLTYAVEQSAPYYHNGNSAQQLAIPKGQATLSPLSIFQGLFIRGLNMRRSCVALEYSCFVGPYLDVNPCLFFTPTMPLKNLRETDYVIGKIPKPQEVRNCGGCWTPCETYATMIFRPWRLL